MSRKNKHWEGISEEVFMQLGFNLSDESNGHTWVQFKTDLFRDTQEYLFTKKCLDSILD